MKLKGNHHLGGGPLSLPSRGIPFPGVGEGGGQTCFYTKVISGHQESHLPPASLVWWQCGSVSWNQDHSRGTPLRK